MIIGGAALRLAAARLAWPRTYTFTGVRADTSWAHQEAAIADVGLVLMAIGGILLAVTINAIVRRERLISPNSNA
jgi:hypothetical protein